MTQDEIEIQEAIDAGDEALGYLEQALEYIKSAQKWGIADIFGGGIIITSIKRSKMKQAQEIIVHAEESLANFSRELNDIHMYDTFRVANDSFVEFADYFFDNPFMDMMVQSRLNATRKQIEDAIGHVRMIQDELVILLDKAEANRS